MTNTTAALPSTPAPATRPRSRGPAAPLPLFLEFVMAVSRLMVLFTGLLAAAFSLLAGVHPLVIGLRSGAAMIAVGLLLWALNYTLLRSALSAAEEEFRQEQEKAKAEADAKAEAERAAQEKAAEEAALSTLEIEA